MDHLMNNGGTSGSPSQEPSSQLEAMEIDNDGAINAQTTISAPIMSQLPRQEHPPTFNHPPEITTIPINSMKYSFDSNSDQIATNTAISNPRSAHSKGVEVASQQAFGAPTSLDISANRFNEKNGGTSHTVDHLAVANSSSLHKTAGTAKESSSSQQDRDVFVTTVAMKAPSDHTNEEMQSQKQLSVPVYFPPNANANFHINDGTTTTPVVSDQTETFDTNGTVLASTSTRRNVPTTGDTPFVDSSDVLAADEALDIQNEKSNIALQSTMTNVPLQPSTSPFAADRDSNLQPASQPLLGRDQNLLDEASKANLPFSKEIESDRQNSVQSRPPMMTSMMTINNNNDSSGDIVDSTAAPTSTADEYHGNVAMASPTIEALSTQPDAGSGAARSNLWQNGDTRIGNGSPSSYQRSPNDLANVNEMKNSTTPPTEQTFGGQQKQSSTQINFGSNPAHTIAGNNQLSISESVVLSSAAESKQMEQTPPSIAAATTSITEQQYRSMSSYNDIEQQRPLQQQRQHQQGVVESSSTDGMGQQFQRQRNPFLAGDGSPQSVLNQSQQAQNNGMIMMQQQMHGMMAPQHQSMPPHHTSNLMPHQNAFYETNSNQTPTQFPGNSPPPSSSVGGGMFGSTPPMNNNLQQQQPQQNPETPVQGTPPGGGGGVMRELRVEDALFYLDDVKREFKDRPAIYNEFLSIMKNFKSQEVDTPGVIDRVSKLFRGYNKLILGFNTFLPDGCKISLADLERAEAQRVAEEQAAQLQAQVYAKAKKPKLQGAKRGPKPGQAATNAARMQQQQQQQQQQAGGVRHVVHSPPGYLPTNLPGQENISTSMHQAGGNWNVQSTDGTTPPTIQDPSGQQQQQPPRGPFGNVPPQASPPPQQHQAVEFDHAISYVTTIKKRFANDPNTYHSFLEILHTYQKEQRGIKEVLEQVARLFQDHSDLLKEFAFFLPDAVQEQAKERLQRAVLESESRLTEKRQQQQLQMDRFAQQRPQVDNNRAGPVATTETIVATDSKQNRPVVAERQRTTLQQPETFVYNSAVERQFFDSTRESLTSYSRDSGQAWAEFMKCLDMYAQEILSRTEMLNFVEPLLGKRNSNLFEEFKRMLTAAGSPTVSTQLMDDAWYSVPLAEIDFGRCRRCSPSYRALPRDYPAPPCSERSEEEVKILNDVWVSLPVGSEESYTFRHMRRNTYEETLFRVEDERFEIDMVIDSNAATLQRLDPIAKEIAALAHEDIIPMDLGIKPPVDGAGLGGKRYQYTFDKKILGVVHRNSIARVYGDNGQEMLELLVRNPTVAVPLVVQRLKQKDTEWRIVRDRLNKHWKDLAEHNYYKSLDHRSLTWRTTDKRAISARTLVAEIKDRQANGGRESKEAYRQKLDKAKEEHGTFFEVTVGEKLSYELDLTFLPKPDRRLFTPHLTLNYKNVSWAQRDAYRILAFALERGTITPADKERCHRLWVEFLGPWFQLSFNWMQKPAVAYQESMSMANMTPVTSSVTQNPMRLPSATVVSEDDEESLDDDPEIVSHMITEEMNSKRAELSSATNKEYTDHHPLPAGAHVSTLYGEGKIIEFRRSDHVYSVRLGFGAVGYLRPATVLCSILPVEKSAYTRQLRAEDRTKLARPNDQLAFGTQSLYLFFRLHDILVQRLNIAKRLAYSVGDDRSLQSMVEQMPNVNPKVVGRRRYEAYLSLIYALLDGGVGGAAEGGKYEDRVRSLLGHQAFELATMDKLIAHIWKDIQTMSNDETMWSLIQLYRRHKLAGSFQPEAFRQEAAYLSDGEPMYAFQHCYLSGSDESVLHIEYLGIMDDGDEYDNDETVDNNESSSLHHPNTNSNNVYGTSTAVDTLMVDVSTPVTSTGSGANTTITSTIGPPPSKRPKR